LRRIEGDLEQAKEENTRLRAALKEACDCGQDGVCSIAPGCLRHWETRNRELVAEHATIRAALKVVLRGYETAVRKAWEPMHPGADAHWQTIREAYMLGGER
jgi:hypothetical protein